MDKFKLRLDSSIPPQSEIKTGHRTLGERILNLIGIKKSADLQVIGVPKPVEDAYEYEVFIKDQYWNIWGWFKLPIKNKYNEQI